MRRLLVRDLNLLCIVAMLLVMGLLAGIGWHRVVSTQHLRATTQRLSDQSALIGLMSQGLREAERTQLAYLSSGADADLLAYRLAVRRGDVLSDRLERNASRDGVFGDKLRGLVRLVERRQDALVQEVSRRKAGVPAATVIGMHRDGDLPHDEFVLDQLAAGARELDHARQLGLDVETKGLRSLHWLGATAGLLAIASVASLFHLLGGAWRRLTRAETEQRTMALQLRGSLDSLSQGVAVFGEDGHLLNWNMRLRRMLDLPAALLQRGLSYDALERQLATPYAPFLEPLQAIRSDRPGYEEIRPVVYERTVRRRAASGETQIEIRRTLMPQGGFVLTLTDMTERVQAERMLREAQKMQALGQLTGGIAHDFNNMLTVILGSLDVSEAESERVETLITRMRRAALAAESGAALTRQLLAFARKQPLAPAPVDLDRVLPELVPLLHHTIGENIAVRFAAEPGLWPAVADAGQLESVVLNLALNARDAMPQGGTLTIEAANVSFDKTRAAPHPGLAQGDYVRIAVADTGHGMSREVMARAFEPFFTTKAEGQGTGLGLAMVFGFARQSGGLALIQSELGQGTRITLHLPRAPAAQNTAGTGKNDAAGMDRASGEQIGIAACAAIRAPHILLVEDDASVRAIASEVLRELGYRVSEAPDAESALLRLRAQQGPLDLLLTDMMLPGPLDGRALAARVRQIQPAARILYRSGHFDGAPGWDGAADETGHWLGKPFRRAQLASKVGDLVGRPVADSTLLAS